MQTATALTAAKPEWTKPTPYEDYQQGVRCAALRIAVGHPPDLHGFSFDLLSAKAKPHWRGVIAQTYGVDLAPPTRAALRQRVAEHDAAVADMMGHDPQAVARCLRESV